MSTIINDLTGEVVTNNKTIARGAFGSICKGTRCGEAVAIKTLDLFPKTESEKKAYNKILRKELTVWARLEGPNIVPLLGYIRDTERGIMSMVCPWMEKGSLNDYLEVNPDISSKRRCQIIKDVANGLTYLHVNHNVIHGDLSGGNILFDSKDKAYLSDFGLAQMAPEMTRSMTCSSSIHPGNILYRPPEHFTFSANTALSKPSKPGDIYSFGSIIFQVLSGRQPYYTKNRTAPSLPYISYSLGKAKTWRWPKRPASISDDSHWGLIQACWSLVPEERPAIQCLADRIDDLYEAANDANSESRIPVRPSLPDPLSESHSMYIFHLPKDATHMELLDFIHRQHRTNDLESTLIPSCSLCPNFLFISIKGYACAIYGRDESHHRDRAILDCSKQKWKPGEKGTPSISCRTWNANDQYGKGSGMWVDRDSGDIDGPSRQLPQKLVPFLETRSFVLRSFDLETLSESVTTGLWHTGRQNEVLLNQAFLSSQNVYLILSVNKGNNLQKRKREKYGVSGKKVQPYLFGIARMKGLIPRNYLERIQSQEIPTQASTDTKNLSEEFEVEWLRSGGKSFKSLLGDDLTKWAQILTGRDGTEVPPGSAEILLSKWTTPTEPILNSECNFGHLSLLAEDAEDDLPIFDFSESNRLEDIL